MCPEERARLSCLLGETEELLCKLACCLELCSIQVQGLESSYRRKELRGLADLLAQLIGAAAGSFHFWGDVSLRGDERRTQGNLQPEFLVGVLRGSLAVA